MEREAALAECTELAALAGPSVSIVRALDLLGDAERARSWAREVAILETEILSRMDLDRLPSGIVTERFARVLYMYTLADDKPALRRYERALRRTWQQALGSKSEAACEMHGTAQNLLVCAILLDKADLAEKASKELPEGPWRELARAWAENDRAGLARLAQRLVDDIGKEEQADGLNVLSDSWTFLVLDRIHRRVAAAGGITEGSRGGR